MFIESAFKIDVLTSLTQPALRCILQGEMFEPTAELFTDILANYPAFLKAEDFQTLFLFFQSRWSQHRLDRLKSGDFEPETLQFARFLLAFGDAALQDLAHNPNSNQSRHVITMLHALLDCEGYAVAEDEVCSLALEFWTSFVEFMVDSTFTEEEQELSWFDPAREDVLQALQECWRKVRIPDVPITSTWDSDMKKGFKDFRKDVADLLQSSYPLVGVTVLKRFVDLALVSLRELAWDNFEAALFYVTALSDCVTKAQAEEEVLESLFRSSEFISCLRIEANVPEKARQTLVNLLDHYALNFQNHSEYLPAALRFLFLCLESEPLAMSASKSIASLCSSCRRALTPELSAFIQHYEGFVAAGSVESILKERVLGAIASIVQALASEKGQAQALGKLLLFVHRDAYACIQHAARQELAEAEEAGATTLRCLTSMGRGMQDPNDIVIDLDSDMPNSLFWEQGEGAAIKDQVVRLIEEVFGATSYSGTVIEAACNVFKTGFAESKPGPFVFSAQITTQFLLRSRISTPRLGQILATACALASSHTSDSSTRIDSEASALLAHVFGIVEQIQGKSYMQVELVC